MHSYEDRIRAVELYYRYGKKASVVVMELRYPSTKQLSRWVRIYEEKGDLSQEYAIHVHRKLLLLSTILLTVDARRTLAVPSATPVTKF